MAKYITLRIVWAFIVLIAILTTTFIFLKLQPETIPTQVDQKEHGYIHNTTMVT